VECHAGRRVLKSILNLTLFVAILAALTAPAQVKWQIDSQASVATMALGSGSDTLNLGVARVRGEMVFQPAEPAQAYLVFTINAGNTEEPEYARTDFESKRRVVTVDGRLILGGELAVTRVERTVTADANEGYSGLQYGDIVSQTARHQLRLVFPDYRNTSRRNAMHIMGANTVFREDFPQLVDAVASNSWPRQLVNREKCTVPSTIGEDYHGAESRGTVIAEIQNPVVPGGTPGGEDFSGFVPAVTPNRDLGYSGTTLLRVARRPSPATSVKDRMLEKRPSLLRSVTI
jgi:hypothetical protein